MWVPSEVFRASRSPVSDDLLVGYRRIETEERGAGVFARRRIFRGRRRMDVSVPPSLIAFYENRQGAGLDRASTTPAEGSGACSCPPRTFQPRIIRRYFGSLSFR
jgi:hypothetical protein